MALFTDSDTALSGGKPRIPVNAPWFCWTFSPWDLSVDKGGWLVANPGIMLASPGVNGVTENKQGDVNIAGALERHRIAGRTRLSDDARVTAWGKERDGYRKEYRPTTGKPQYHDVWQSWDVEAGEWVKEVDAEGYTAFLRVVAADMNPTTAQIARAVRRARNEGREKIPDNPWIVGKHEPPNKPAKGDNRKNA